MDKTTRQVEGALKWRNAGGSGMQVFPTGFGKTLGTIRQIIAPMQQKRPYKVIILVHRTKLLNQWESRLKEELQPQYLSNITVQTVQWYISNSATDSCDLLVVDEIHKFYGEDYVDYINGTKIQFKFNLGLTATPYDKQGRHLSVLKVYPIVDTITQAEAIENGWISKFVEFNVPVELNDSEASTYRSAVESIAEMEAKFDPDNSYRAIQRAQKVLYGGEDANGRNYAGLTWAIMYAKYNGWHEGMDKQDPIYLQWNPNVIVGYAANLFKAYKERDNVLNHCLAKYTATIKLLRKFKDLKAMCFSESTYFADKLASTYNFQFKDDRCVVFHSQLPSTPLKDENGNYHVYKSGAKKGQKKIFGIDSIKKHVMDLYVNNKNNVRILSTARILDEGFDCEDIRMGIITSRSSNHNQQIQRGGRIKRIVPDNVHDTMLIVNIYVANTDDVKKLHFAQKHYTHDVKFVQSVDDVSFDAISDDEIDVNEL